MPFVLVRADGNSYSLYGWNKNRKTALQFRSEVEAQDHVKREGLSGVQIEKTAETTLPGVDPNGAAGIFGYGKVAARG